MEEGDTLGRLCSDLPTQNVDLGLFDFDAFLKWEFPEATEPSIGIQQSQAQVLPIEKKRGLNDTTQPCVKRARIQHSHICDIHRPLNTKAVARCFGSRSRLGRHKGTRCERMLSTYVDGQLPVCVHHKSQVMKMMHCEATLKCGSSCNEIAPWKPHGYVLCEAHLSLGQCYFMELPVEIRMVILQYLIPARPVQARWHGAPNHRRDRTPVTESIFRVSKKVHEEVADLFYAGRIFEIDVTNERDRNAVATPNVFMCHARDDGVSQLSGRTAATKTRPSRPARQRSLGPGIKHEFTSWQPSLSLRCFQRIRSFRINITFEAPKMYQTLSDSSETTKTAPVVAERNLLCDYLHQVVESLVTNIEAPLQNLDISICIQGFPRNDDDRADSEAIEHCQALLNPIRRLRSRTANIVSLTRTGHGSREIDVLSVYPKEKDLVNIFVQSCCAELTGSLLPPPRSPILVRFGQLAEVVSKMSQHPFWRETDLEDMESLLSIGRSARETNDMKALVSVFQDVFHKLNKYNSDHLDFMMQMKQSCEKVRSSGM